MHADCREVRTCEQRTGEPGSLSLQKGCKYRFIKAIIRVFKCFFCTGVLWVSCPCSLSRGQRGRTRHMVSHPQGRKSVTKWLNNQCGLHKALTQTQSCFEARGRAYQKTQGVETHPNPRHFNAHSASWKLITREHGGGTPSCPGSCMGCEMFQLNNGRDIRLVEC